MLPTRKETITIEDVYQVSHATYYLLKNHVNYKVKAGRMSNAIVAA